MNPIYPFVAQRVGHRNRFYVAFELEQIILLLKQDVDGAENWALFWCIRHLRQSTYIDGIAPLTQ